VSVAGSNTSLGAIRQVDASLRVGYVNVGTASGPADAMSRTEVAVCPMPPEHHGAFGQDPFGRGAENLLNLAFSTQAAYAAPLILLAQTRQADRDKDHELLVARQREEMQRRDEQSVAAIKTEADSLTRLLQANTDLTRQDKDLTEQVADLTKQIHALLTAR
jgi:uncharacterized protein DUF1003